MGVYQWLIFAVWSQALQTWSDDREHVHTTEGGDQFASSEGGDLDLDLNTQGVRSEKAGKPTKGGNEKQNMTHEDRTSK